MLTLVTGATGFVGINIVEALLERGDEVIAFGHAPLPDAAQRALARFGDKLSVLLGDVRDSAAVEALFAGRRIDRLVHGAVITAGVEREKSDPATIVDVNVRGTALVLQIAHAHRVGRVVYISSGSAYGQALFTEQRLYEDITHERPTTMYQITKFAAERTALRLRALLGLDLICVRLGSVIGPWERDTGVRDTLSLHYQLRSLAEQGQHAVLPARESWKDMVYSRDISAGVVALLEAPSPKYSLYNLSSGRDDWHGTLPEWCEQLASVHSNFKYRIARDGEQPSLSMAEKLDRAPMDIGRIVQDIGFKPAFGPREAYADLAQWLRRTG
jgi:nucleoside-diphosphate-sugar epimerase